MRNLSFVVAALLALPSAAHGQHPAHLLPTLQTADGAIKPGTWVEYTIFQRATQEISAVRVAALERVPKKGQWFEISITDRAKRTLVFKTLVAGTLSAPKGVLRTIIQPPGHQPVELPVNDKVKLPRMSSKPDPAAKLVGSGKVKVAAGTFTAMRHRTVDKKGRASHVWSSKQVPGWPMVKAESPEALLELSGYGGGATSQIRGKPGKLDPKLLEKIGLPR